MGFGYHKVLYIIDKIMVTNLIFYYFFTYILHYHFKKEEE
jgi:hypothetical protein